MKIHMLWCSLNHVYKYYEQGAYSSRIGQYVKKWGLWVRSGKLFSGISKICQHIVYIINGQLPRIPLWIRHLHARCSSRTTDKATQHLACIKIVNAISHTWIAVTRAAAVTAIWNATTQCERVNKISRPPHHPDTIGVSLGSCYQLVVIIYTAYESISCVDIASGRRPERWGSLTTNVKKWVPYW